MHRLVVLAHLAALIGCLLGVPNAGAADGSIDVEPRCVAAAMTLPPRLQTIVYNRNPQSKIESRIEADVVGEARRLPRGCADAFTRRWYGRVQFQSSTSGRRWLSVGKAWESLDVEVVDAPPTHEFLKFGRYGASGLSLGSDKRQRNFGCVLRSRVLLKLELVEERTGRIVAARFAKAPGEVDLWRAFRCLGRISIRDDATACGQSALGVAGRAPHVWTIAVRRVGCASGARIARAALRGSFADATLASRAVSGWRCVYSLNSAAACLKGSRRIYLRTRRKTGAACAASSSVRSLTVARTSCSVGRRLGAAAAGGGPEGGAATHRIGGRAWRCFAFAVAPVIAHHCYGGSALISFDTIDRGLLGPQPTVIPAGVIYPGNGASAIGRTPFLRIEDWSIDDGQVMLEVLAEDSLVGQTALLEVALEKWRCGKDTDPDPLGDGPNCGRVRSVGRPIKRRLTLQATQRVPIGRIRRSGNWAYDVRITTEGFSAGDVRYGPAKATTTFLMLN